MDPMFKTANLIEAGLWITIGLAFALRAALAHRNRRISVVTAAVFVAFGFSDVVETRTGAWWRPRWLLSWKAACIAGMVALFVIWRRSCRDSRRD